MIAAMRQFGDWILGRGEASITIPIFDGALKPNQMLESAEVVAEFEDASDIAADRDGILVANGRRVARHVPPHSNGEVPASSAGGGVKSPNTTAAHDPSVASAFSNSVRKARNRATSPPEWGGVALIQRHVSALDDVGEILALGVDLGAHRRRPRRHPGRRWIARRASCPSPFKWGGGGACPERSEGSRRRRGQKPQHDCCS